jgi:hypothetical protein
MAPLFMPPSQLRSPATASVSDTDTDTDGTLDAGLLPRIRLDGEPGAASPDQRGQRMRPERQ